MQEWYLGREKVSCLERCPQFRCVLIESSHCINCTLYSIMYIYCMFFVGTTNIERRYYTEVYTNVCVLQNLELCVCTMCSWF